MTLVSDTYTTYLIDRELRAREFELLGRLVATVPVRGLVAHADMTLLPAACGAVLSDLRAATGRPQAG
jgi:hypothetical protein